MVLTNRPSSRTASIAGPWTLIRSSTSPAKHSSYLPGSPALVGLASHLTLKLPFTVDLSLPRAGLVVGLALLAVGLRDGMIGNGRAGESDD